MSREKKLGSSKFRKGLNNQFNKKPESNIADV